MLKGLVLGFSATVNMVLVGIGGAAAGMATLATVQRLRRIPPAGPSAPYVAPQNRV